jgi:hypothetical protein
MGSGALVLVVMQQEAYPQARMWAFPATSLKRTVLAAPALAV